MMPPKNDEPVPTSITLEVRRLLRKANGSQSLARIRLSKHFMAPLIRYLRRFPLRDTDGADDVANSVLRRAFKALESSLEQQGEEKEFVCRQQFWAYLRRIAYLRVLTRLKGKQ